MTTTLKYYNSTSEDEIRAAGKHVPDVYCQAGTTPARKSVETTLEFYNSASEDDLEATGAVASRLRHGIKHVIDTTLLKVERPSRQAP